MEFRPGHGVFYFEQHQAKKVDPSTMNRNLRCANCGKSKDRCTSGGLKRCVACEYVAYCSKECQTQDWPNHKAQCKLVTFHLTILENVRHALEHPKIIHYLRVAIAVNGKLASFTPDDLGSTLRTALISIGLQPDTETTGDISTHFIGMMFDQNVRPDQMVLPSPGNLEILKNLDGYLKLQSTPLCERGGGQSDPKDSMDLWKLAKETQLRGYYRHGKWTVEQAEGYKGKMGEERAKNPVVVVDWLWDNVLVKNAVEITPEAMRDAKRMAIDASMRFQLAGEEKESMGDFEFTLLNGLCGLCGNINEYIQSNDSLNLKGKMSAYDKRIHVEMQMQALKNIQARIDRGLPP